MATPTELLNGALLAMAELHDSMTPDEREENAILPAAAVRKFVDSHARLMFERERMTPDMEMIDAAIETAKRSAANNTVSALCRLRDKMAKWERPEKKTQDAKQAALL